VLVYAKKLSDGTTLYFEEVLDSSRNKSLRSKTMNTDMSNAKIIGRGGTGGNPDSPPPDKQAVVAANSTERSDRHTHERAALPPG